MLMRIPAATAEPITPATLYQRYIENQIRAVFGLTGTPIKITIRQKGDKEDTQ